MNTFLDYYLGLPALDAMAKPKSLLWYYEQQFRGLSGHKLTIVEVGVYKGHFLSTLDRFFPNADIIGIDRGDNVICSVSPRTRFEVCDQTDASRLDAILQTHAPGGIDILIDDASHVGRCSFELYKAVFERWIKPGGWYFVEDWGTGYWDWWVDGSAYREPVVAEPDGNGGRKRIVSHDAGMVGFVKTLVDEVGSPNWRPPKPSSIESLTFRSGVVKIIKRATAESCSVVSTRAS